MDKKRKNYDTLVTENIFNSQPGGKRRIGKARRLGRRMVCQGIDIIKILILGCCIGAKSKKQ